MICKDCSEDKKLNKNNFELRKDKGIFRFRKVCKKCMKKRKKEYYLENIDYISNRAAKYYDEHKEEKHEYYVANKTHITNRKKEHDRKKLKNEPWYRMRKNVGRIVNMYLTINGGSKNNVSFFKAIGYTPKQLRQHIESQFEDWMSWNNYGVYKTNGPKTWNIDHIIPQSLLPFSSYKHPNFKKCWNLENLRPLDSKTNIIKGNKII